MAILSNFFKFCFFNLIFVDLAVANELLLFSNFNEKNFNDENIKVFMMSEKLDGVRGIWDTKSFKSRKNYIIKVPSDFINNYPPFELDGEFFIQRASFDEISSLIRSDDITNKLWERASFNVFDVPNACKEFNLNPCTLENRLNILKEYLEKYPNSRLKIIPQIKIQNLAHLKTYYEEILKKGGEGLIIRKNELDYEKKRSNLAFKFKPFFDAECEVVGYTKGKGKNIDKVGSLLCKMQDERVIKIGSGLKDKDRINPPPIGSIITYKFNGLTKNNLPRFPVFLRIRN
ncbi:MULTISPECIES: DNA ligase [unclassified Campylobacter]|uniref:DNA ligase n=1 Tax=unclassified Campylobacter TaxID=2593542 RepID=UPI001CC2147C|nr:MULTISPECIES: DNA ligase [unclassified Campylobacter]